MICAKYLLATRVPGQAGAKAGGVNTASTLSPRQTCRDVTKSPRHIGSVPIRFGQERVHPTCSRLRHRRHVESEDSDEEMRFIGAPFGMLLFFRAYHHGCWKLERFDDSVSPRARRLVRKAREEALCVSGADHCAQQKCNRNHHFQSHDVSEAQQSLPFFSGQEMTDYTENWKPRTPRSTLVQ
jgi:hypothetical protein